MDQLEGTTCVTINIHFLKLSEFIDSALSGQTHLLQQMGDSILNGHNLATAKKIKIKIKRKFDLHFLHIEKGVKCIP